MEIVKLTEDGSLVYHSKPTKREVYIDGRLDEHLRMYKHICKYLA